MTRRQITPVEFASALRDAQGRRACQSVSTFEAVRRAVVERGLSDDWSAPLLGFINDSPASAEAWAERVTNDALDRAAGRIEG